MKVLDYTLENKGAAAESNTGIKNSADLFTYVFADERSKNLHVCYDQDDEWIKQRDNGKTLNVDASIVAKFTDPRKPRA
jgi:hypothetical protein